MITCKYCGEELSLLGMNRDNHFFSCDFCDLTFTLEETCSDRKRMTSVPEVIPEFWTYMTTKQMLQIDTITLYHTLKSVREFWYQLKVLLEKSIAEAKSTSESEKLITLLEELKEEYTAITKKKFSIENIILERTGFLPSKITDDFLDNMYGLGVNASKKRMNIYLK